MNKGLGIRQFMETIARVTEKVEVEKSVARSEIIILFLGGIILTILTSLSYCLLIWISAVTYSVILSLLSRENLKEIFILIINLTAIGTITGLPLIYTNKQIINNIYDLFHWNHVTIYSLLIYLHFVLRIIIAPLPTITSLYYLGWPNIVRELYKVKVIDKLASLISIFLITLPKLLRNMLVILTAREARLFTNDTREKWKLLASGIGDFLIQSHQYGQQLEKAINARTFNKYPFEVAG